MRRLLLILVLLLAAPAQAGFYDLLDAARANDLEAARAELQAGTEPNGGPSGYPDSYSPLQWAADHGNIELMRLLLAAGADTERRDFNGDRPLLRAARAGQAESIRVLLDAGSPVNSPDDPYGNSPLHLAVRSASPEAVAVLIAAGAGVDALDQGNGTPLREAALIQDAGIVRLLLEAGADPNIADDILRETPLHLAAEREEAEIVRLLLAAGANPVGWNSDGADPLHRAAFRGLSENVAALLEAGADPRALDAHGLTPLRAAIEGKRFEVWDNDGAATLLVPFVPDIDATFVAAAGANLPRTTSALIDRGADLARHGPAALLAAAQAGSIDVVRLLLAFGVPPIPPGQIPLAEFTPVDILDLGGEPSRALDTSHFALREAIEHLRSTQLSVRDLMTAAFVAR